MQRLYAFSRKALCAFALLICASAVSTAQWTTLPATLNADVMYQMNVMLNGKLYSFGGIGNGGTVLAPNMVYDVAGGGTQWQQIASYPSGEDRMGGVAVAYNGKIYIVGGVNATNVDKAVPVLEYDPDQNTWATKSAPSTKQWYCGGTLIGSQVICVGGLIRNGTSNYYTANVTQYDLSSDGWSTLTSLPAAEGYPAVTSIGNTIYVAGGSNGGTTTTYALSNCYKGVVNGLTITWTTIASLPTGTRAAGAGLLNGKMYVAGGDMVVSGSSALSSNTFVYDPGTNKWSSSYALPKATGYVSQLPGDNTNLYYCLGSGNTSSFKFAEGAANPVASITPASLDYAMKTGGSDVKTLSVKNNGVAALTCQISITGTPWLTTDKSSFTVQPGSTTTVTVTANSTGMTEGSYNGTIKFTTNDPANPTVNVPVTMQLFDNVETRRPLLETFSSSTCGPCYYGNQNLHNVLGQINDRNRYTVLKNQQDFPSTGDPYATTETVSRRGFYGINAIPWMMIDGGWNGNSQSFTQAIFENYAKVPAFMRVEATHKVEGQKITVQVTLTPLKDYPAGNYRLMIAVCEKLTSRNVKTNNETEFHDVVKKMLPDQNGTIVGPFTKNVPVTITKEFTFAGNYRLPSDGQTANRINNATENSVEEFSDLEAVAWVQDFGTKEVLNSAWSTEGSVGPQAVFKADFPTATATVNPTSLVDFNTKLTNLTNSPLQITINRTAENFPSTGSAWTSSICAGGPNGLCYPPDFSGPLPMDLPAGGTDDIDMKITAGDAKNATGTVTITLAAPTSSGQPLMTKTFTVTTNNVSGVLENLAVTGNQLAIGQAFPNPAQGITTLSFNLPSAANVSLELFDVNGNKVLSILNEHRSAGNHTLIYDMKNVPAGTYNLILKSNGKSVSNKLTVVH